MRFLSVLTGLILLYLFYGMYLAQRQFTVTRQDLKRENAVGFYDYRGVTNVKSDLSEGSSEPTEIINAARRVGLDFLVFNEVNLPERMAGLDGYQGNLLVMSESEYTLLDTRILHYSGARDQAPANLGDARLYLTDLLSQPNSSGRDSLLVVAHPFLNGPTWVGDFPTGVDGLEVLNPKSLSEQAWIASKLNVVWSLICYPFNANFAFLRLFQEPGNETTLWDQVNRKQKVFGYAGADATARAIPFARYLIKFPSYEKSFEITSNHILTESELNGSFQKDRLTLLSALKKGQFYFSLDLLGDPKGFLAFIQDKDRIHLMGSTLKLTHGLRLISRLPAVPQDFYEIVILKDGERLVTVNRPEVNFEIKAPGVYRIAVRVAPFLGFPDGKKWLTWIYTNPFFIK